jgi:hypothetical protein
LNEVPPSQDPADEVDDLYRRAAALDASRPSEPVRRAILEHAVKLAAQRSLEAGRTTIDFTRPAANRAWRRPAIFGTLAAAALAGLMIAPQFLATHGPDTPVSAPSAVSQSESAPAAASGAGPATVPAPAPPQAQARESMADMQPSSPPSAEAKKSSVQPRAAAGGSARVAKPAAAVAANNARAEVQSSAAASSAAPASGGLKSDARRMQGLTSSMGALSAGRPQAAAPVPPAARVADPAAELRRAAEAGDLAALQTLLDQQSAIDARDDSGRTALMLATLHGQSQAVDVLLANGADPNAADARGTTPLQAAVAGGQPAIAAALRRAGAR